MPALAALLLSLAFTLVAIANAHTGSALAAPTAVIVILLMAWQARRSRDRV